MQIYSGTTAMSQKLRERTAAYCNSQGNLHEGKLSSQAEDSFMPVQVMVPQGSQQAAEMLSIASVNGTDSIHHQPVDTPYHWLKNSRGCS